MLHSFTHLNYLLCDLIWIKIKLYKYKLMSVFQSFGKFWSFFQVTTLDSVTKSLHMYATEFIVRRANIHVHSPMERKFSSLAR